MAIDSRNKRFSLMGEADAVAPAPDGSFASAADRWQLLGLYAFSTIPTAPVQVATTPDIVNLALSLIGEAPIQSLTNPLTKTEKLAKRLYDTARDAMLELFDWPFARRRAVLTRDGTGPAWGYTARYPMPPDCIHLRAIDDDSDPDYQEEDGYLLYNGGPTVNILYTYRATVVTRYSPLFVQVLAHYLAGQLAGDLVEDPRVQERLVTEFQRLLPLAMHRNSLKGSGRRRISGPGRLNLVRH